MWGTDRYSLLPFLTALLISAGTFAQSRFDAGISAGVTGSQISGDNLSGFNKLGIHVGLISALNLNANWDLITEINYVQKGSRQILDPEKPFQVLYMLRLHYVEVPLIARYHQGRFLFEAGISGGALISSREEDASGVISPSFPFHRGELAGQAGLGTTFGKRFSMVWRYSNSILPVRPHASGATFRFNRGQYSNVLHFVFQYRIKGRE